MNKKWVTLTDWQSEWVSEGKTKSCCEVGWGAVVWWKKRPCLRMHVTLKKVGGRWEQEKLNLIPYQFNNFTCEKIVCPIQVRLYNIYTFLPLLPIKKKQKAVSNLYLFSLRSTPPGAGFQFFVTREQQAGVKRLCLRVLEKRLLHVILIEQNQALINSPTSLLFQ